MSIRVKRFGLMRTESCIKNSALSIRFIRLVFSNTFILLVPTLSLTEFPFTRDVYKRQILIPPSNPMIIYGVVANTSIAGLFMAGFIPGFVMTTSMCITAYCIARKRGYKGTREKFSVCGLLKAIWDGKWALATPVIILGGIYCGVFTPTEAAEVGVLWTLFVGLFV